MPEPKPADKRVGTVIAEKYRVDKLIARGGFSKVYRGTQLGMGRPVAVKLLELSQDVEATALERFGREARLVSQLKHPNTITIFDYGQDERGFLYIVMEHINGRSLSRQVKKYGALAPADVAFVAREILKSLDEAHARGILHRDLKPSNIMIARDHNKDLVVKVLDFGVAKILEPDPDIDIQLTAQGAFVGTPRYASPEQMRRETATEASDIYGVGMIMWEALVGSPAVPDIDFGVCVEYHLGPKPWSLPLAIDCPPGLANIVHHALQKKAENRYATCREMLHDLESWMAIDQELVPEPLQEVFNAISEVDELSSPRYEENLSGGWAPDVVFDPDTHDVPQALKTTLGKAGRAMASDSDWEDALTQSSKRPPKIQGLMADPEPPREPPIPAARPAPIQPLQRSQSSAGRGWLYLGAALVIGLGLAVTAVMLTQAAEGEPEAVAPKAEPESTETKDLPVIPTDTILAGMRTAGWLTSGKVETTRLGDTRQTHTMVMYTKANRAAAVTIYECDTDQLASEIASTTQTPAEVVSFGRTVVKIAPGPSSIRSGVRELTQMLFSYKELMQGKGML